MVLRQWHAEAMNQGLPFQDYHRKKVRQACDHNQAKGGQEINSQGIGRIGFHHARNAGVKSGYDQENADAIANPGVNGGYAIQKASEEEWAQTIAERGKAIAIGMFAVESFTDFFQNPGSAEDGEEIKQ